MVIGASKRCRGAGLSGARKRGRAPDDFVELLGAALLFCLDPLPAERRQRLGDAVAAVHAKAPAFEDWPTAAIELLLVARVALEGGCRIDKAAVIAAAEADWRPLPRFAWQDRADAGDDVAA